MSLLTRRYKRKNWRQVFDEKVSATKKDPTTNPLEGLSKASIQGLTLIRLVRNIKNRRKKDLVHPSLPSEIIGQCAYAEYVCNICYRPNITDVVTCRTCYSAYHYTCIIEKYGTRDSTKMLDYSQNISNFTCCECDELCQAELDRKGQKDFLIKVKTEESLASLVISNWLYKRWNIRQKDKRARCLHTIQSFIVGAAIRRRYSLFRCRLMRVSVLDLVDLTQVNEGTLISVCVLDSFKLNQIFRIDKFDSVAKSEAFLLPGICGDMTLTITICTKSPGENTPLAYCAVLQGIIALKDLTNFTVKKSYKISFSPKIVWLPVNTKGDTIILNQTLKNFSEIERQHFKKAETVKQKKSQVDSDEKVDDIAVTLHFVMHCTYKSFCGIVQGPVYEVITRHKSATDDHQGSSRSVPWWMCLYRQRLYIYIHYGASQPVIVQDMTDAIIVKPALERTKAKLTPSLTIAFKECGKRWNLHFQSRNDACRFEYVLLESRDYHER